MNLDVVFKVVVSVERFLVLFLAEGALYRVFFMGPFKGSVHCVLVQVR